MRLGMYEVIALLGQGGMGEVYRARDTRLKRDVAIKVLPADVAGDRDRMTRFQREAEVLAALNHPHIAHIYGLEESPDQAGRHVHALVMELVEGEDLSLRIARGRLPLEEALAIARQLAEALEYAHVNGIVHRDLKPANIKVAGGDGSGDAPAVKVLDFGLAKALDPAGTSVNQMNSPTITTPGMTGAGVVLGTAGYMSPEQARGAAVDKRADIWAFGVVLFEMLTGRRLFEGETVSDTIAAVLRAEPEWTRLSAETPPTVRKLLGRCLEKDRKRRLQDIGDARIELDEVGHDDAGAPQAAPGMVAPAPMRTPGAMWALVAALTVACAALGWMAIGRQSGDVDAAQHWRFRLHSDRFLVGGRAVALSPDGTTLAFAAAVQTGGRAIYVRKIDELAARILPGTEQAVELFFSPDSQWIGFSAGGLKKIPVSGGQPITVSPLNANGGSVWAPDGTIYFSSVIGGNIGLWKVASSGGQPTQVAAAQANETGLYHPELSDDGKTLLATVAAGLGSAPRIAAYDLATGRRTIVMEGAGDPRIVNRDYLLVSQPGRVMAVRWNARSLTSEGRLTPLLEGVATNESMRATMAFSRNGALVYVAGAATGATQGHITLVDRSGRKQLMPGNPRGYWDPRVSPDGKRIAFDSRGEDIFVADLSTGATSRLSFSGEEDETPVWSPDGARVAYSSTRGAERLVFIRSADGSGSEHKAFAIPAQGHIHLRDWSPDGGTLLFDFRDTNGTRNDIRALDLATGKERPVVESPANEGQARLSPNGKFMAYTSNESGRYEVYVLAFPVGQGRWQVSTAGGVQPEWSADGKELFFRHNGRLQAARISNAPSFAAAPPQPIESFEDKGWDANSSGHSHWTRAGERFLFFEGGAEGLSSEIQVLLGWQSLLGAPKPR